MRMGASIFATIAINSGETLPCRIENLSLDGAGIECEAAPLLPEDFTLVFEANHSSNCRVAWRSGNRLGVVFVARSHSRQAKGDAGCCSFNFNASGRLGPKPSFCERFETRHRHTKSPHYPRGVLLGSSSTLGGIIDARRVDRSDTRRRHLKTSAAPRFQAPPSTKPPRSARGGRRRRGLRQT